MTFLKVDQLPEPGRVCHALERLDDIGGAGAVATVQMARLSGTQVDFFTALGRDDVGQRSLDRLNELGVSVHVAWREGPTRQGISMVGPGGDRAITVIGPRLQPEAADPLPWQRLPRRRSLCHCNGCPGPCIGETSSGFGGHTTFAPANVQ